MMDAYVLLSDKKCTICACRTADLHFPKCEAARQPSNNLTGGLLFCLTHLSMYAHAHSPSFREIEQS